MRLKLLIIVLTVSITGLHAQTDDSKKKVALPDLSATSSTSILGTSSNLKMPNTLLNYNISKNSTSNYLLPQKDEKGIMEKEQFLNSGDLYVKKLNKGISEKEGENRVGATTDQLIGDYKNNGTFVKILCRDHQAIDGDRVRIYVNDVVVQPDVLLVGNFKGFRVDLQPGFNKIDFQALNTGESGPNTAQLLVLDDKGNIITSNEWNLSTGVKASVIVVKDENKEE